MFPKCLRINLFSDLEYGMAFGLDVDVPTIADHCPGKFELQSRS